MRVFFSVGEPSGDLHGANLVKKLSASGVQCIGFGGKKMEEAGCEILEDLTKYAVMLWNAFLYIPKIFFLYRQVSKLLSQEKFDAMVLIDYPGFNWWMARCAKKHGVPVFYYGVPQMWAWNPGRVKKLKRLVDYPICKLPFEQQWFNERGCDAHYVGHPYFDELCERSLDDAFLKSYHDPNQPLITLLPGSRDQEVKANLETLVQSARRVQLEIPDACIAIACYNHRQAEFVKDWLGEYQLKIDVFVGRTPELIELAAVCLACSGSVSLELLYHQKPSVIVYQISPLNQWLKDKLVTCQFITLVNLFAAKSIERDYENPYDPTDIHNLDVPFPEFASAEDPSEDVARHVVSWLSDSNIYRAKRKQLKQLKNQYAIAGASQRAGSYILKRLQAKSNSDSHSQDVSNPQDVQLESDSQRSTIPFPVQEKQPVVGSEIRFKSFTSEDQKEAA